MLHPERTGTRAKRPEKAVAHVRRGGRAAHARMTREKLLPQGSEIPSFYHMKSIRRNPS